MIDSLIPVMLNNGKSYILAVVGPQQVPQTIQYSLTLDVSDEGVDADVGLTGGDVDHECQHNLKLLLMECDDDSLGAVSLTSRDENITSYAIGTQDERILFAGLANGKLKAVAIPGGKMAAWHWKEMKDWNTPVNVLIYTKSNPDNDGKVHEYLMAGLNDSQVWLLDLSDDKKGWILANKGGKWASPPLFGSAKNFKINNKNVNIGFLALENSALMGFDFDHPEKGFYEIHPAQAGGDTGVGSPTAGSRLILDNDLIKVCVAYANGAVAQVSFSPGQRGDVKVLKNNFDGIKLNGPGGQM